MLILEKNSDCCSVGFKLVIGSPGIFFANQEWPLDCVIKASSLPHHCEYPWILVEDIQGQWVAPVPPPHTYPISSHNQEFTNGIEFVGTIVRYE
jgi:hypothetical protein